MSAARGLLMARAARNLGLPEATVLGHLQSGLASASWDRSRAVLSDDERCLFLDDTLPDWNVYVDVEHDRVFINTSTWSKIMWHGPAELAFTDDYLWAEEGGMKFIVSDAGVYADAARAHAKEHGSDVVARKDRLTLLAEQAQGLIVQAASLNDAATSGQAQTFAVRYATLRAEFVEVEQELARLRSLVDLAGTAVYDATS